MKKLMLIFIILLFICSFIVFAYEIKGEIAYHYSKEEGRKSIQEPLGFWEWLSSFFGKETKISRTNMIGGFSTVTECNDWKNLITSQCCFCGNCGGEIKASCSGTCTRAKEDFNIFCGAVIEEQIEQPSPEPSTTAYCKDSDNGLKPEIFGYLTTNNVQLEDFCYDDYTVMEGECRGTDPYGTMIVCGNGKCSEGICIAEKVISIPNIEIISTEILVSQNKIIGKIRIKNSGIDMSENYVAEMQVVKEGMGFMVMYISPTIETCDPNYPNNIHKKFSLDKDSEITISLETQPLEKGIYKAAFFLAIKCYNEAPGTNRIVPGQNTYGPFGETSKLEIKEEIEKQIIICGNGKLESGEECDDGNKINGDGCSSECKKEIKKCSDGTPYGQCSQDKPKYCLQGVLIDKASICGCISGHDVWGENCKPSPIFPDLCSETKQEFCNDKFELFDLEIPLKVQQKEYFYVNVSVKNLYSQSGRKFIECGMYTEEQINKFLGRTGYLIFKPAPICADKETNVYAIDLALGGKDQFKIMNTFKIKALYNNPTKEGYKYYIWCIPYEICKNTAWDGNSRADIPIKTEIELVGSHIEPCKIDNNEITRNNYYCPIGIKCSENFYYCNTDKPYSYFRNWITENCEIEIEETKCNSGYICNEGKCIESEKKCDKDIDCKENEFCNDNKICQEIKDCSQIKDRNKCESWNKEKYCTWISGLLIKDYCIKTECKSSTDCKYKCKNGKEIEFECKNGKCDIPSNPEEKCPTCQSSSNSEEAISMVERTEKDQWNYLWSFGCEVDEDCCSNRCIPFSKFGTKVEKAFTPSLLETALFKAKDTLLFWKEKRKITGICLEEGILPKPPFMDLYYKWMSDNLGLDKTWATVVGIIGILLFLIIFSKLMK